MSPWGLGYPTRLLLPWLQCPQGCRRSSGPPLHPQAHPSKCPWASPYPSQDRRAPAPPLVIAPQEEEEELCSPGLPPKIVSQEPYYTWVPFPSQLWDCHDMLRGEGKYQVELECFHSRDPCRTKNQKQACKFQGSHHILGSQGEAHAHGLVHLNLSTGVVCQCQKTFSNAKTLGTHLRQFHNISLAAVHRPTNPQPILEDPTHRIASV